MPARGAERGRGIDLRESRSCPATPSLLWHGCPASCLCVPYHRVGACQTPRFSTLEQAQSGMPARRGAAWCVTERPRKSCSGIPAAPSHVHSQHPYAYAWHCGCKGCRPFTHSACSSPAAARSRSPTAPLQPGCAPRSSISAMPNPVCLWVPMQPAKKRLQGSTHCLRWRRCMGAHCMSTAGTGRARGHASRATQLSALLELRTACLPALPLRPASQVPLQCLPAPANLLCQYALHCQHQRQRDSMYQPHEPHIGAATTARLSKGKHALEKNHQDQGALVGQQGGAAGGVGDRDGVPVRRRDRWRRRRR